MSSIDIIVLSAIEVFGDFNLRWYAQSNNPVYFGYGLVGYIGVVLYLIKCLRSQNVMYVNGMWDSVSTIIESLAAYVVLGDRLERPSQYVGLVLIIVGIFMLKNDSAA